MSESVIFIADLHLNDQHPESYQRFKHFLNNTARKARALYILGDLFEYYIGDDVAINQLGVAQNVINDLKDITQAHQVKCYFMAGNRDFLLSDKFAEHSLVTILAEPTIISLDNKKIILCHGDEMCTDDKEYQHVRSQIRTPQWQKSFLNLSVSQRIEFAQNARKKSQQHTRKSSSEIMDVNQNAVDALFKKHKTQYMIHGHTHRPAFHHKPINNDDHLRMVLGDWHHQISYIEYKNNNFQLVTC